MAKAKRSLIVFIVDRSGSMSVIAEDMTGGINQFIEDQKEVEGECKFTLAQFDTVYEVIEDFVDINDVKTYTLVPRGATALNDAVGLTLTSVKETIDALPKKEQPKKIIVAIVTDGYENSSKEWSHDQVKEAIKARTADGWEFTYLAANQDAFAVGTSYGIQGAATLDFATTGAGVAASFSSLSNSSINYRSGAAMTMAYNDVDRKKAKDEKKAKFS